MVVRLFAKLVKLFLLPGEQAGESGIVGTLNTYRDFSYVKLGTELVRIKGPRAIELTAAMMVLTLGRFAAGQARTVHHLTGTDQPTGAIGRQYLIQSPSSRGYFQPVRIKAPRGALIAPACSESFSPAHAVPLTVGLLVGHVYRLEVSHVPLLEDVPLYPTIELIGRLHPPAGCELRFPIPIELTSEELRLASEGNLVTRVIYVEDPELVLPVSEDEATQQRYFDTSIDEDPLHVADELGRPVAILRIGSKSPPPEGPDDAFLFGSPPVQLYLVGAVGSTQAPPSLLCPPSSRSAPLRSGWPRDEYVCDGGDNGLPAVPSKQSGVLGLDPSDTVARFDASSGETLLVASNRTCIYAPRFAAARKVIGPAVGDGSVRAADLEDPLAAVASSEIDQAGAVRQPVRLARDIGTTLEHTLQQGERGLLVDDVDLLEEWSSRLLPFENLEVVRSGLLEDDQLPQLRQATAAANQWLADQAVQVVIEGEPGAVQAGARQPQTVDHYELPPGNPRLRIVKLASQCSAEPGETVHFTIRFDNIGDDELRNVSIIDNLTTRLDYVDGSQECTRDATFSVDPNAADSLRLTWQLVGPIEAGEGGVIRFQCRVR